MLNDLQLRDLRGVTVRPEERDTRRLLDADKRAIINKGRVLRADADRASV